MPKDEYNNCESVNNHHQFFDENLDEIKLNIEEKNSEINTACSNMFDNASLITSFID